MTNEFFETIINRLASVFARELNTTNDIQKAIQAIMPVIARMPGLDAAHKSSLCSASIEATNMLAPQKSLDNAAISAQFKDNLTSKLSHFIEDDRPGMSI